MLPHGGMVYFSVGEKDLNQGPRSDFMLFLLFLPFPEAFQHFEYNHCQPVTYRKFNSLSRPIKFQSLLMSRPYWLEIQEK